MMSLENMKIVLNDCVRSESQDHAFGDAEVFWEKDGVLIAEGYFSGKHADVFAGNINFSQEDARILRQCGKTGTIGRNDETGPAVYTEGKIMPNLTASGVLRELIGS